MAEPSYLFPNAWELALRRMQLLEHCHDPATMRRVTALGVADGHLLEPVVAAES